jgi:hypothetical protein
VLRDVIRRTAIAGAALVVMAGAVARAPAQVTTEGGASILVFPKVVADSSTDTVIQLANRSDNGVDAFCSYVNGAPGTWQSLGFSVALGPGRPTHWSAAQGRMPTAGEDTVDVPAAPASFHGELLCVQVDVAGAPFSGNSLAGQATLVDLATGTVAAYAADGLLGSDVNDSDDVLCVGGPPFQPSDNCPNPLGAEYDGCPAEWVLDIPTEGSTDAQLGAGSALSTRLAVAPCSQDLRDATPGSVDIQVTVFNELAQQFVGSVQVACWADLSLADVGGGQIFTRGMLGTDYAEARLQPAAGSGGFMLVAQTTRSTGGAAPIASDAGVNLHHSGSAAASDLIVLPESPSP